jgi:hypothetical protein
MAPGVALSILGESPYFDALFMIEIFRRDVLARWTLFLRDPFKSLTLFFHSLPSIPLANLLQSVGSRLFLVLPFVKSRPAVHE